MFFKFTDEEVIDWRDMPLHFKKNKYINKGEKKYYKTVEALEKPVFSCSWTTEFGMFIGEELEAY